MITIFLWFWPSHWVTDNNEPAGPEICYRNFSQALFFISIVYPNIDKDGRLHTTTTNDQANPLPNQTNP